MEVKDILQLIERFDSSKATKLQVKVGDAELLLENTQVASCGTVPVVQPVVAENVIADEKRNAAAVVKATPQVHGIPVKAPLVGTFYCAPSPEEPPFVMVGQSVKKGDVIGIIEAMKLMNEITAPEDGVVKTVLAQNGNMVEYGEVLMVLE